MAREGVKCGDEALLAEVAGLFDDLRRRGWHIGIDAYVAASRVALALATSPEPVEREALKRLLRPIVCRSAEEQRGFDGVFDVWQKPAPTAETPPPLAEDVELQATAALGPRAVLGYTAGIVVGLFVAALLWLNNPAPATSQAALTTFATPSITSGASPSLAMYLPRSVTWQVFGLILVFVLAMHLVLRHRRRFELRRVLGNPRVFEERVRKVAGTTVLPDVIRRTAQQLRIRRTIETLDLDGERTAVASARLGGFFTPVYKSRGVLPEYLVLIDRAAPSDHVAALASALVDSIERSDVPVTRYDFQTDPRFCWRWDAPGRGYSLIDLALLHRDHRLIVVSDGSGLFDPRDGKARPTIEMFSAWPERSLMSPLPRESWGDREETIERFGFFIAPVGAEGLATIADTITSRLTRLHTLQPRAPGRDASIQLRRRWLDPSPPADETIESLRDRLRAELEPEVYAWLAACAIYPVLRIEITIFIGRALGVVDRRNDRYLLELSRLPWFRRGSMPDWLRERLVRDLGRDQRRRVREALLTLLTSAPAEKESASVALTLATRRGWFERLRMRLTITDMHLAQPDGVLGDYTLLDFLRKRSLVSFVVPKWLRNLFVPLVPAQAGPSTLQRAAGALGLVVDRIAQLRAFMFLLSYSWLFFPLQVVAFAISKRKTATREIRWHAANGTVITIVYLSIYALGLLIPPFDLLFGFAMLPLVLIVDIQFILDASRGKVRRTWGIAQLVDLMSGIGFYDGTDPQSVPQIPAKPSWLGRTAKRVRNIAWPRAGTVTPATALATIAGFEVLMQIAWTVVSSVSHSGGFSSYSVLSAMMVVGAVFADRVVGRAYFCAMAGALTVVSMSLAMSGSSLGVAASSVMLLCANTARFAVVRALVADVTISLPRWRVAAFLLFPAASVVGTTVLSLLNFAAGPRYDTRLTGVHEWLMAVLFVGVLVSGLHVLRIRSSFGNVGAIARAGSGKTPPWQRLMGLAVLVVIVETLFYAIYYNSLPFYERDYGSRMVALVIVVLVALGWRARRALTNPSPTTAAAAALALLLLLNVVSVTGSRMFIARYELLDVLARFDSIVFWPVVLFIACRLTGRYRSLTIALLAFVGRGGGELVFGYTVPPEARLLLWSAMSITIALLLIFRRRIDRFFDGPDSVAPAIGEQASARVLV